MSRVGSVPNEEDMKPIEILSEAIIEVLKDFSATRSPLTAPSLKHALASRDDLIHIFSRAEMQAGGPSNGRTPRQDAPSPKKGADGRNAADIAPIRDIFKKTLVELGALSREETVQRSSELQQRFSECQSMDCIVSLGDELIGMIRVLVFRTVEERDTTSGLLAEVKNQLTGMEKQLIAYHGFNEDAFRSNEDFRSDLLSRTVEIQEAFDREDRLQDRSFIVSKLQHIKAAIEAKQREDKMRLSEANRKIAELKANLKASREEILLMEQRTIALEQEVLLDSLTGIHNRRGYEVRIREELRRYHRDGQPFSLILIDVDHFKKVNDLYGHRSGDRCLREIATRIRGSIRATDYVARYGGEEFIVILGGSAAANACKLAEKVRMVIESTRFVYEDRLIPITVSSGVTEVIPSDEDPEPLFVRADSAMYQAKKEGRNRVCNG